MAKLNQPTATRETNLSGRNNAANQFREPLNRFTDALAEIRPLWDRLTPEHRERVLEADPVLSLARELYAELGGWFDAQV